MADDIEEFLRRAIQRRMEAEKQARGQQPQQQFQAPPQRPAPQQPAPRRQPPARPRTLAQSPPMVVEAQLVEVPVDQRAAHMQREVDQDFQSTRQFGERAKQLGQQVGLADDNLDAHLHQTFDHTVGSIKQGRPMEDAAVITRAADSPIATELLRILASPKSLAAAFILNDVLNYNPNRWDDEPK